MRTSLSERTPFLRACVLAVVLVAAGCGGGGIDSGGIGGSGFVEGPIEGFGSVVVAGIRFDVDDATITVDGELASDDELELGMRVSVAGTIAGDEGVADIVEFEEDLRGPVESVNAAAGTITVLGRTVRLDASTVLAGVNPANLPVGTIVRVSGLEEDDEGIVATRIDRPSGDTTKILGRVRSLSRSSETFRLPPVLVDYSSATFVGLSAEDLANGETVAVRGTLSANRRNLTATQVRAVDRSGTVDIGDSVRLAGIVATELSGGIFELASGREIVVNALTVFAGGTIADLTTRTRVLVEGQVSGSRDRVRATRITIRN
jgi:hypothetical protein